MTCQDDILLGELESNSLNFLSISTGSWVIQGHCQLALQVRTQNLPENNNNEAPAIKKALHTWQHHYLSLSSKTND